MKDLFITLVKIPSPSGGEQAMREFISDFLNKLKVKSSTDSAGNLLADLGGTGKRILMVAHMDTVQKPGEIVTPKFKNGTYFGDGSTILGADNKAGVAILLTLAKELSQMRVRPKIYFAFTTNEEVGRMGSSQLNLKKIEPDFIINVDGNKSPGVVDVQGLGQTVFELEIKGKSAHAALEPGKGIHAIKMAARIVTSLKMGKFADGSTLNIGQINGGTSTNVVPDKVSLKGEARAFSDIRLEEILLKVSRISKTMVKTFPDYGVPVWDKSKDSSLVNVCKAAAKKAGVKFRIEAMLASSDANYLARYGVPTINVNRGGANPHSYSESITLDEMEKTKEFLAKIIEGLWF